MTLNKQGEGKIDWTDFTWNPVSGCLHNCSYCYMKRLADRKLFDMTPKFFYERLKEPGKIDKPSKFFVCSSGDLLGEWVHPVWISEVQNIIDKNRKHIFQILTKNPKRYLQVPFAENAWLGTTIDTQKRADENLHWLKAVPFKNLKFISFEPLLEEINCDLTGIDWIIIGANSNKDAEKPKEEWVNKLVIQAIDKGIPIWIKDNLGYIAKIKDFPRVV